VAEFTHRVQTVLTDQQYSTLSDISRELARPLSVLIREAIEKVYFEEAERERRRTALSRILSLDAPVADWEQMEEEISRGILS
jgi:predicted DNA-binding protein